MKPKILQTKLPDELWVFSMPNGGMSDSSEISESFPTIGCIFCVLIALFLSNFCA
jgi:hypothetical protein